MSLKSSLAVGLLAWLAACAPHETSAGQGPVNAAEETPFGTERARPPLRAELTARDAPIPGKPLVLSLQLRRSGGFNAPAHLSWRLPEGVRLRSEDKRARDSVVEPAVNELEYSFELAKIPQEDLVLSIAMTSGAGGYHAELHYRFGRPPPVPRAPQPTGPSVRVGQRDFGPAIAVGP